MIILSKLADYGVIVATHLAAHPERQATAAAIAAATRLPPATVSTPTPLKPVSLSKQGDDRLVIVWSDGHDTGIFTLENLRALCQCPACRPPS